MMRFPFCALLILTACPAFAGEAASPEQAMSIIADRIESRDVDGALAYFTNAGGKDVEVLRIVAAGPDDKVKRFAETFRHPTLKSRVDLHGIGYEGAIPGDESVTYTVPFPQLDGTTSDVEMTMCGRGNNWVVCNW